MPPRIFISHSTKDRERRPEADASAEEHERFRVLEYARGVLKQLEAAGIRATVDERSEKVNLKIRDAQLQKIPYMLVVGDREQESGKVAVRNRKHGDQGARPLAEFIGEIQKLIESKAVSE